MGCIAMTTVSISEDLLSGLLKRAKSKQVFAFEEIQLENPFEYVEWAVSCLGLGFDHFLLPLVSHLGKSSVNYFEIRDDLRAFFSSSNILPPRGRVAFDIYCIGCIEDLINGLSSERNTLQHMADLLSSNQGSMEFGVILDLDFRFWHPNQNESCDDVLRLFHTEAESLVKKLRVVLKFEGAYWRISVA